MAADAVAPIVAGTAVYVRATGDSSDTSTGAPVLGNTAGAWVSSYSRSGGTIQVIGGRPTPSTHLIIRAPGVGGDPQDLLTNNLVPGKGTSPTQCDGLPPGSCARLGVVNNNVPYLPGRPGFEPNNNGKGRTTYNFFYLVGTTATNSTDPPTKGIKNDDPQLQTDNDDGTGVRTGESAIWSQGANYQLKAQWVNPLDAEQSTRAYPNANPVFVKLPPTYFILNSDNNGGDVNAMYMTGNVTSFRDRQLADATVNDRPQVAEVTLSMVPVSDFP